VADTSTNRAVAYPYRVFISYAHEDQPVVEKIAKILECIKLKPIWDRDIHPGAPFTDAIKEMIARSHIFVPIITEHSQTRPWVHQETGYAQALNLPILPVAVIYASDSTQSKKVPSEMIAQLQAITVQSNDLDKLADYLLDLNLEELVNPLPRRPDAIVQIADWPETRTELMIRHINWVTAVGGYQPVRMLGAFTSFAIPDKDVSDSIWDERDSRSLYHRTLLREERRLLERHVRACDCKMVLEPFSTPLSQEGKHPRAARYTILRDFFASLPHEKLKIIVSPKARSGNTIILGDYFVAESISPRPGGYLQTVFNSHPPTVIERIRRFDQVFDELYPTEGISVDKLLQRLDDALAAEPVGN